MSDKLLKNQQLQEEWLNSEYQSLVREGEENFLKLEDDSVEMLAELPDNNPVNRINKIFDQGGFDDETIVKELKDIYQNSVVGNPGSKNWDMMEDWKTKLKVIELAMKAKGILKPQPLIQVVNSFQKTDDTQLY